MGGSKPKVYQLPEQRQQQQTESFTSAYAPVSIAGTPEAKAFLDVPLDFGGGGYSGEAYKGIKTDFNLDPGVGRRTDLAEQEAANRWNSAFMSGIPAWVREQQRAKETRDIRSQGAAEAQQAEYGKQQAEYAASLARAQMADAAERAKAEMANNAAAARTQAELERRRLLLPAVVQTGGTSTGTGSSSGYTSTLSQPQPGFLQSLGMGFGAGLGQRLPFI
jgi:uncharacterized membrane protein YqiK